MDARTFLCVGRLVVLAGSCLGAGAPALAQNALDHNQQVGSGGVNPSRPDFAQEVRLRNAIVTGNVPGGMSFRGNAGYRAPGEFDSNLGSNQLFAFRRDSYYSGLGGLGIRGTDALQYQFAATTGNAPPPGYSPILGRSGTGATSASVQSPSALRGTPLGDLPTTPSTRLSTRLEDLSADSVATLRSPAAFNANRELRPAYLGSGYDEFGRPKMVSVSPLRGIAFDEMPGADAGTRDAGLTGLPRDTAKPERPGENAQPEPARPGQENPVKPDQRTAKPVDARVDQRLETSQPTRAPYDDLMDRMRKAEQAQADETAAERRPGATGPTGATGETGATGFDQRLNGVRDTLRAQSRRPLGARPAEGPPRPGEVRPGEVRPGEIRPGGAQPPEGTTGATGATGASGATGPTGDTRPGGVAEMQRGMTPETLKALRSTQQEVRTLAPPGFDPYAQAMRVAQDHLAGGRFFDAEERFTSALSARPGDPMAAAGRVNAEIGAGMFLSGAINLRSLLTEHPEMTGVKYAPDLRPSAERTPVIMSRLNGLVDAKGDQSRDAALLLAFLGYQTGDQAAIAKGLEAMVRGAEPGNDQNQRLTEVLRAVWLQGAAPPAAPRTAPPSRVPAPPAAPSGQK